MGRYLLRRLLTSIPVILGITVVTFILISMAPGDPAAAYVDMESFSEEALNAARERLGLNDPLPVQYVRWLSLTVQGDLGNSLINRQPVGEMIARRLWSTVRLTGLALIVSTSVGMVVGVVSAVYKYSIFDYISTVISFAAVSIPGFFLSLILIYLFALQLGLWPTSGMYTLTLRPDVSAWDRFWDSAQYHIMPVIALSASSAAPLARFARSSMLEVLNQEYLQTARAKGMREQRVIIRHALPNALLPIITETALRLPLLFGGSVIIESIFNWQGIGSMSVKAVLDNDYPVIMGVNLIFAVLVLASNLLADLLYAVVDPRVRYD